MRIKRARVELMPAPTSAQGASLPAEPPVAMVRIERKKALVMEIKEIGRYELILFITESVV